VDRQLQAISVVVLALTGMQLRQQHFSFFLNLPAPAI
jgi:cytochrome b subunit of formate dehydrogenase